MTVRSALLFLARAPLAQIHPEPRWLVLPVKVLFWLTFLPLFPVWLVLLVWQEGR